MKKYILFFLLISTTSLFSQTSLTQNEKGELVETTTNVVKLSSSVTKCYEEKGSWFCITEDKTIVSKEQLEKQVEKDAEMLKEIATRKEQFTKIKTKN